MQRVGWKTISLLDCFHLIRESIPAYALCDDCMRLRAPAGRPFHFSEGCSALMRLMVATGTPALRANSGQRATSSMT